MIEQRVKIVIENNNCWNIYLASVYNI
jgi:hypothetical protein